MNAFIFPGQGSQFPGMGKEIEQSYTTAKECFEEAEDQLQLNLRTMIFEGSEEELTRNSQLAIYVVSVAVLRALVKEFPHLKPDICAGHSLGEYSALTAAGILSFKDGLKLVQKRSELMTKACEESPGAMAAVIGLTSEQGKQIAEELPDQLWVANFNCPGQIVLTGTKSGIEKGIEKAKEKGARKAIPLRVQGAFHSPLMNRANQGLSPVIEQTTFASSDVKMVMNVPGNFAKQEDWKKYLMAQMTHSVRWQEGIEAIESNGVQFYLEIGPGNVLKGLNRRIGVQAKTVSICTPDDFRQLETEKAGLK